jgi:hypothetical protein
MYPGLFLSSLVKQRWIMKRWRIIGFTICHSATGWPAVQNALGQEPWGKPAETEYGFFISESRRLRRPYYRTRVTVLWCNLSRISRRFIVTLASRVIHRCFVPAFNPEAAWPVALEAGNVPQKRNRINQNKYLTQERWPSWPLLGEKKRKLSVLPRKTRCIRTYHRRTQYNGPWYTVSSLDNLKGIIFSLMTTAIQAKPL